MSSPHSDPLAIRPSAQEETTLVHVANGALRGHSQGGVNCFYAIPYAAPPVGELRFTAPRAVAAWKGVRDSTVPGPVPPQLPSRLRNVLGDFERNQSEDCLTLTVWTPGVDARRRPVLVWLHGGAFATGGGDLPWHDGARLACEGDIVVVAVNYRLAALGFLYSPGVSPGNMGLMDQMLALEWVRENIAAFGGDPHQVTLMGQSAGGLSIALLLTHPEKVVPVRRAIMMSAPLGVTMHTTDKAERVSEVFMRALKVQPGDPRALTRLQQAPLTDILAAQGVAMRFAVENLSQPGEDALAFLPVGDGQFAPINTAFKSALAAAAEKVDVLIGTTRDEGTAFIPNTSADGTRAGETFTANFFALPAYEWARQAARAGRAAYLYRFDWASPDIRLGAAHCIELPFVFGTRAAFSAAPLFANANQTEIDPLSDAARAAWIAFVRKGNPNTSLLPNWPASTQQQQSCMLLDQVSAVVAVA